MQLKSTFEIFREYIEDQPQDKERHEAAAAAVDEYLQQTYVILENIGENPFKGMIATFDGHEYVIEPGKRRQVPLAAVVHFLGNWASTGYRRRIEYEVLKARYGYFETLASEDIELFIRRSQALSQAMASKNLPKRIRTQLEDMAERLPVASELPKLRVLDVDTEQELPCKWPLYDPEWQPVEDAIPNELKPVYDALAQKLFEERKEMERRFVTEFEAQVGGIDTIEDEEFEDE